MRDHMLMNGSHTIPNKHATYSRGAGRKGTLEGKAVVPPTLKGL